MSWYERENTQARQRLEYEEEEEGTVERGSVWGEDEWTQRI